MSQTDGYRAMLVPNAMHALEAPSSVVRRIVGTTRTGSLLSQLVIKRDLSRSQHLADTVDLQATSNILVIYVDDFNISIDRSNQTCALLARLQCAVREMAAST